MSSEKKVYIRIEQKTQKAVASDLMAERAPKDNGNPFFQFKRERVREKENPRGPSGPYT